MNCERTGPGGTRKFLGCTFSGYTYIDIYECCTYTCPDGSERIGACGHALTLSSVLASPLADPSEAVAAESPAQSREETEKTAVDAAPQS